ncbi:ATP phosphoribosyltransferase [uncultured Tolumonas sp.]|uniref:ATP phosphoribosyltransferase n=1 Tax=uncultured Tolumonas sp. TaxID=263765 RepID=UPI00292D1A02|nr:ATP phosphoribosyltransferase [uncultured Tolumonas sp.]
MSILIALPKGRIADELLPLLEGTPLALDAKAMKSRVLRIPTASADIEVLLLKGSDLPRYVAGGVAALGVVGSDTLDECEVDLLELADLKLGACRLSLCAPRDTTLDGLRTRPHLRIATKYVRMTRAWLRAQDLTAELVPLQSSVELAPILGLADAIVDLVQTGGTLKAHGLVELTVIGRTSARLVAARGAYLSEPERIAPLARMIVQALGRA